MSAFMFLETLRKHDLEQFYPTFSTHGITHLQGLAQLSVQDYAQLGITDTADRKRIFALIQLLRKETANPNRLNITTSASTAVSSGLRQPQTYSSMTKNAHNSPTSPSSHTSRLPQSQNPSPSIEYNRYSRVRRQSVLGATVNSTNTSTNAPNTTTTSNIPSGHHQPSTLLNKGPAFTALERSPRSRTLSDASRFDPSVLTRSLARDRRPDARRSLMIEPEDDRMMCSSADDDDDDDESRRPTYRASAPLLDTYGVPIAPGVKQRASVAALRLSSNSTLPSDLEQKIRVCVRKRPLNKKELERAEKDIAPMVGTRSVKVNEPKLRLDMTRYIEQHTFTFDDVFDSDAANTQVYKRTALPLVRYIFEGGKATCFAYGQTGSGKTFTMLDPRHGLYVLAATDIFSLLREPKNQHLSAWIGLYEIYQGHLYDLLNERRKLFAREDAKHNVIISGLREYAIDNVDKLIQVFEYGNQVRSTGTTGANDSSSRSHAVLQILLKPRNNKKKIHGKLSFIDLAGSERGADRGEADTKTRMEGAEINKSLLALKECIRALDQDKRHTPFRQSKLTQVLKDSFVGKSRTCMIATISPGSLNSEHTLNTLRYADRVKELKGERGSRGSAEKNMNGAGAQLSPEDSLSVARNENMYGDEDDEEDEEDEDKYMQDDSNEEYYSNGDSDVLDDDTFNVEEENIFDVDFPHEQDAFIRSSALESPSHKPIITRHHSIQQPPPSSYYRMSDPPDLMDRRTDRWSQPPSDVLQRSPLTRSSSVRTLPTAYGTSDSPPQRVTTVPPPAPAPAPETASDLPINYLQMEEFVKFHRAEIREVTECTKRETKLVANISLDLSSNQDFADDGADLRTNPAIARHQQEKSNTQFQKYLRDLDEVLERKMAAVEALRDRISETVGQLESKVF